jgi:hypothetical protein
MHRVRLTGELRVPLPPDDAFRLFTPLGERDWVAGWDPVFPAPVEDDAAPGAVFTTAADGHSGTWVVVDRDGCRGVRYARVVAGRDAGTVTVQLAAAEGHTRVRVTYELTALSEAGDRWLRRFADGYPGFLQSWERALR